MALRRQGGDKPQNKKGSQEGNSIFERKTGRKHGENFIIPLTINVRKREDHIHKLKIQIPTLRQQHFNCPLTTNEEKKQKPIAELLVWY